MRISDWSSDVCSSDLAALVDRRHVSGDEEAVLAELGGGPLRLAPVAAEDVGALHLQHADRALRQGPAILVDDAQLDPGQGEADGAGDALAVERSEEHTSELQSLMRISYAVFCLQKKKTTQSQHIHKN